MLVRYLITDNSIPVNKLFSLQQNGSEIYQYHYQGKSFKYIDHFHLFLVILLLHCIIDLANQIELAWNRSESFKEVLISHILLVRSPFNKHR